MKLECNIIFYLSKNITYNKIICLELIIGYRARVARWLCAHVGATFVFPGGVPL